jgi:hypothetical protein
MTTEPVSGRVHCPCCSDFVGYSPAPILLTGMVTTRPFLPNGLVYMKCIICKLWLRYEITPPKVKAA